MGRTHLSLPTLLLSVDRKKKRGRKEEEMCREGEVEHWRVGGTEIGTLSSKMHATSYIRKFWAGPAQPLTLGKFVLC